MDDDLRDIVEEVELSERISGITLSKILQADVKQIHREILSRRNVKLYTYLKLFDVNLHDFDVTIDIPLHVADVLIEYYGYIISKKNRRVLCQRIIELGGLKTLRFNRVRC